MIELLANTEFNVRLPLSLRLPTVISPSITVLPPTYNLLEILAPPLTIKLPVLDAILVVSLVLDIIIGIDEVNVCASYTNSGVDARLLAPL